MTRLLPDPELDQLVRELNEREAAVAATPRADWPAAQVPSGNQLEALLIETARRGASDLHLISGSAPVFRVGGRLIRGEGALLSEDDISSILESLLAELVQPVWFHDCATAIDLPDEAATVVLKGLEALDVRAQHALMARLDRADARQQIISLSERSPFALVQRGQFLEPLYRRLSVVYLRLDTVEEQPAGAYCA